jgi:hypothetical protein
MKNLVSEELRRWDGLTTIIPSRSLDTKPTSSPDFTNNTDSDDDDDFEDVPDKEGFELEALAPPVQSSKTVDKSTKSLASAVSTSASTSWKLWGREQEAANDPTTLQATLRKKMKTHKEKHKTHEKSGESLSQEKSAENPSSFLGKTSERKERLLRLAPKLPFDIDLYHWEDKDLKAPAIQM